MATATENTSRGVSNALAHEPMGGFQVMVVLISILLNALDGFDVLAITFAAPGISEDWAISRSALGVVISSGLAGMAAGSIVLSPIADRFGRRPTIIICLLLMTVGMFLTATASSITMLCVYRIVTGLGIGGLIPSITAVSAEFSNEKRRDLAVSAMTIGFPIGGLLGSYLSAELIDMGGWRAIFHAGGFITAAFLPLVWFGVPESLEFLATKGGAASLGKINAILKRMGHKPVPEAHAAAPAQKSADPRELFGPEFRVLTLLLISAYFLHIMTFYFYSGWLPKILTDAGFTTSTALNTAAIMNIGGIIGGVAIGWVTPYFGLKRLAVISMAGTSVTMALFALVTTDLPLQRIVAFILGVFMFGGIVGLYAFLARAFPARLRVTGCGLAIAIGRGGGIIGPVLGGVLLDAGLRAGSVLMVVGVAAAFGAVFLLPTRIAEAKDSLSKPQ